jgi:hypothetical protein
MARKVQRLVVGQQYIDSIRGDPNAFYLIKVKYIDKSTRRPAITRLSRIARTGISKPIYPMVSGVDFLDDDHLKRTYNKHEFMKLIYKTLGLVDIKTEF